MDISEKKVTDEELRLAWQLFRNLLEHTTDAIYFKDLDSRFIQISNQQAHNYGLNTPDEARGKSDFDFFKEEHATEARRDERAIMESGEPVIGKEEQLNWPDGHVTWVSTSKMPLRDDQGRVMGTFGVSRNITKRKLAEEALRKSEENLRLTLEAMERDLNRARVIQRALLPVAIPEHPHLNIAVRYQPLDAIGGDYYSVTPLAGDSVGVFIGDVMGHGVSAALFMALLKFLTDMLARSHGFEPKVFLEKLNLDLMDQMPMSFTTGIYGVFQPADRGAGMRLDVAGAGHPPPIVYRAATGEIDTHRLEGNAALGLTEEYRTEPVRVEMQQGDRVFFYTDGIPETTNVTDEILGYEGLVKIMRGAQQPDLQATLDAVMADLSIFRGDSNVDDDILLLGFELK